MNHSWTILETHGAADRSLNIDVAGVPRRYM